MKFFQTLFSPKYRIHTAVFIIILIVYFSFHFFIFESDPVMALLSFLSDSYLSIVERLANMLIYLTGYEVKIETHQLISNGVPIGGFIPQIRFKIWMFIFLLIIWVTKTTIEMRILYSIFLIIVHYLIGAIIMASGAYLSGFENSNLNLLTIPVTFGLIILFTILFLWYRKHKSLIMSRLTRLKINTDRFKNDSHVFVITITFILLYYFLFDFFEYGLWIDFLFTTSQKILGLFGYKATVEPFNLIGANGTIFMLKSCLGYQTMLLFAAIVFLTGNTSSAIRWIYIISGLIIINFANILRFVFLFVHIEKNGKYMLSMDVHDMYNYIIYFLVFVLWVIWFEKFADYGKKSELK